VDQNGPGFNPARTVYNLNLQLVDTTGGGNTVVASSSSTIDTSETISAAVVAGRNYSLKVLNAHGSNFNRDYGIAWRIEADRDRDGLPDRFETGACPAVGDADSDDDGIPDGVEDANLDGVVNPGETNPCNPDTDGDGLQDGTERGITVPVPDPDDAGPLLGTDTQVFVPDADPSTTTSATLADTDGDGFSDGEEDRNRNGRVDAGESDPNHAASTPPVQPVPLPAPSLAALGFLCAAVARWRGSRQFR
jgi:hypothetical protein